MAIHRREMNQPQPLMIYLAGPMDGITWDEKNAWRQDLADEYPQVLFFMPQAAFRNDSKTNAHLVNHLNHHAIHVSHAVLANLSGPGRGFGTIREIQAARTHGKYVVISDEDGSLGPSIMTFDCELVQSLEAGMLKILEWHTEQANQPATIFGIPMTELRPVDPDEDRDDDD